VKPLTIRYFAHSWVSDWNHGNAHFLRGLARALVRLGHRVRCYEQLGAWSLANLMRSEGERAIGAIDQFRRGFPELDIWFYNNDEHFSAFAHRELRHADLVIIHEWNDPRIVNQVLALKDQLGFRVLLHDTHHRAYTSPREILKFHLHRFDGVLTFGEAITRIYRDGFGVPRAWTLHEAADITSFVPLDRPKTNDVVWIGNWGDEERTLELEEFLLRPAEQVGARTVVHGVRYPREAVERMRKGGIEYRGYLPNLESPRVYGESRVTVHVPRRQYNNGLSGIPTIRVFEALACGVPLVCAPWPDTENLFSAGQDYLTAVDGRAMGAMLAELRRDDAARRQLAAAGLATIRARHTCAHRAEQLVSMVEELGR